MVGKRELLAGAPHRYWIGGNFVLDAELFCRDDCPALFLEHLERVRRAFDASLFAWRIDPSGYEIVAAHRGHLVEDDAVLRARWRESGGGGVPADRLRRRLTSLGGLMQSLSQGFTRRFHQRYGGRGSIWQPRYRSCLLADDSALLSAVSCVERSPVDHGDLGSSRERHGHTATGPALAPLPLGEMAGGMVLPLDRSPIDHAPPEPEREQDLFDRWTDGLRPEHLRSYTAVLGRSWALGLAESLTEVAARLGRAAGRGRSRRLRELDDDQGLCGLWG